MISVAPVSAATSASRGEVLDIDRFPRLVRHPIHAAPNPENEDSSRSVVRADPLQHKDNALKKNK